jgi:hypothetical protein
MKRFSHYDFAAFSGEDVLLQAKDIQHYQYANWHKVIWNREYIEPHVVYDVAYLYSTGLLPPYDLYIPYKSSYYRS